MKKNPVTDELFIKNPVHHSLRYIGGKWKIDILWSMRNGCKRFGELRRSVTGITEKMLFEELRNLEGLGVIKRQAYNEIPPKVEYSLNERGLTLLPLIEKIISWGDQDLKYPADN